MAIALIILSVLLWGASIWLLMSRRQLAAPAASYVALVLLSLAKVNGIPLVPLSNTMLLTWLFMTLIVMIICMLQPAAINQQTRGTGYMTLGAVTGMAVGLLVFGLTASLQIRYLVMILATILGTMIAYYLFTTTPQGRDVGIRTGRFFGYLLAKGVPVAASIILLGLALTVIITI